MSPIQIKIADFGISISQPNTYLQTTCGTRAYQAPEQLGLLPPGSQGRRGYTKAVDIWAVGVLLYKMLTTLLPFQTNDRPEGTIFHSEISTLVTEGDQEPSIDFTKLLHYCHGSGLFPTESLLKAGASTQAVDFVKSLLAAKPKERVSAGNAQMNPWLIRCDGTLTGLARVLESQFMSLGVQFPHSLLEDYLDCSARPMWFADDSISQLQPVQTVNELVEKAARRGYLEAAAILRVFIDISDIRAPIPLITLAATGGHLDAVSLLLANGANPNSAAGEFNGRTPLQAASERGHIDIINLLLNANANINAAPCDAVGRTALQAAAGGAHLGAISLLLSRGAFVNAEAGEWCGKTALQAAVRGKDINAGHFLLWDDAGVSIRPGRSVDSTASGSAAECAHIHAMLLLLAAGANPNAPAGSYYGRTALQQASENGHPNAIRLLLRSGADPKAVPCAIGGITALQAAAGVGNLEAIHLLLKSGADVNAAPAYEDGGTALQAAVERGCCDAIILLLRSGADINAVPRRLDRKLSLQAAARRFDPIAERLIQWSGSDRSGNIYCPAERTALQEAVWHGDMAAVQVLLESGANAVTHSLYPSGTVSQKTVGDGSISDE